MSLQLSLQQISKIIDPKSSLLSDELLAKIIPRISTDTRQICPGELFLALRGEQFDGHNFLAMAIEKGASALIMETEPSVELPKNVAQLQVGNSLISYQKIAKWWRNQFNIPLIAVTGSVGKTTTKELIAAVLSTQGEVHKTFANYNNHIGVPKTLLQLDHHHSYGVIEMAMRAKGEIALLSIIAQPTIGVITNVGTAHIGRLGSREAIAQAKCELLAHMPDNGVAVLNHDCQLLISTAATVWQGRTVTYGLQGGDITGQLLDNQVLRVDNQDFPLPLPGRHNALNYLAAIAVAKILNLDLQPLTQGLSVNLPSGRAKTYHLPNDIIILDETYNAGLESMIAALHLLKETAGLRHIAVLGTMKELGDFSVPYHLQVGKIVQELNLDYLFLFIDDPQALAISQGAQGITTECFENHGDLIVRLQDFLQPGDRLLCKASHSVGLHQVVEQLLSRFSVV